jgi:hypothetical protein
MTFYYDYSIKSPLFITKKPRENGAPGLLPSIYKFYFFNDSFFVLR